MGGYRSDELHHFRLSTALDWSKVSYSRVQK